MRRVRFHRAKLNQGERHLVPSDANLAEERAARIKKSRNGEDQQERTSQNEADSGEDDVEEAQHSEGSVTKGRFVEGSRAKTLSVWENTSH